MRLSRFQTWGRKPHGKEVEVSPSTEPLDQGRKSEGLETGGQNVKEGDEGASKATPTSHAGPDTHCSCHPLTHKMNIVSVLYSEVLMMFWMVSSEREALVGTLGSKYRHKKTVQLAELALWSDFSFLLSHCVHGHTLQSSYWCECNWAPRRERQLSFSSYSRLAKTATKG